MAYFSEEQVSDAVERIKETFDMKTDVEVAEFFGITRQKLSQWKSVGKLDVAHIKEKLPNMSIDWLLHGVGEPNIYRVHKNNPVDNLKKQYADNFYNSMKIKGIVQDEEMGYEQSIIDADDERAPNSKESPTIPVYYGLRAGVPTGAYTDFKEHIKSDYIVNPNNIALEITTDDYSKNRYEIGDLLVIDKSRKPTNGNIVLVQKNNEMELYLYKVKKDGIYIKTIRDDDDSEYKYDKNMYIIGVATIKIKSYV